MQSCNEASVAPGARHSIRVLLLLRMLLLESEALVHLTMTDHARAQECILAMHSMHARFPALLAGALHSTAMVTGA